jgi:uncharacterized DUF497 family protein
MKTLCDKRKDAVNQRKHGISLGRAGEMDFTTALVTADDSQDYGETREVATGFLAGNLYVLTFVMIDENTLRAISLRKATPSERQTYAEH